MPRTVAIAALGILLFAGAWAGTSSGDDPTVVVVPITNEIDPGNAHLVRRAVEEAKSAGAKLLVFEIDTPGGRVDNALEISEAIEGAGIPTVAYVTRWAMSAGALIALSCDEVVMAPGASIGAAEPIGEMEGHQEKYTAALRAEFRARAQKKKYPELLAEAMVDKSLEVWQAEIDGQRAFGTPDDLEQARRAGKKVRGEKVVNASGHLLCLAAQDAVDLGLARRITALRADLLHEHGMTGARVVELAIDWSEKFVRFLTQSLVVGLLVMIGIACLLAELKSPGLTAPGVIGVLCFAAVFFGHHLAGLASYTHILLFVIGVILIGIEVFVLPGSMVVGVPGLILALAGLVLSLQGFVIPHKEWEVIRLRENFFVLTCAFGGAMVAFLAVARYLPKSPLLKGLVLSSAIQEEERAMPQEVKKEDLVGKYGKAMTPLRPSGKIELDGRTLDVVTEGDPVDAGVTVQVVKVEGPAIVVAPLGQR